MSLLAVPVERGLPSEASRPAPRPEGERDQRERAPHAGLWSLACGSFLLIELVAATVAFDTGRVATSHGLLAVPFAIAPQLLQAALAAAGVSLFLLGPTGRRAAWSLLHAEPDTTRARAVRTMAHLALVVACAAVTDRLVAGAALTGPWAPAWFVAWAALVAGVAGSALRLIAPLRAWCRVGIVHGRTLLAGAAFGAAGWFVGAQFRHLWNDLAVLTFEGVTWSLALCGFEVLADRTAMTIGTPAFRVHIAPACSGYEGLGLVAVFVTGFLIVLRARLRFPPALLLLPVGLLAAFAANVVRIAVLIGIGSTISPDLALGGFHSQAGWLSFNAVAIGLMALALHVPALRAREPETRTDDDAAPLDGVGPIDQAVGGTVDRTTPYVAPLVAFLAAGMLLEAFTTNPMFVDAGKCLAAVLALAVWRDGWRSLRLTGWIGATLAGGVVFAFWIAIGSWEAGPATGITSTGITATGIMGAGATMAAVWWRVLGSVLVVPLIEELAFRGYLVRRLVAVDFENVPADALGWKPVLVSSLAFGLLHGWWVAGTLAGVLLAVTARRRGLGDAVLAHVVANGLVAAAVVFGGQAWLW